MRGSSKFGISNFGNSNAGNAGGVGAAAGADFDLDFGLEL
jgi:hypothetical protein